LKLKFVKKF